MAGDPESVAQMRSHSTNPEIIVYLAKEVANKANRASDLGMEIPETRIQISQNRLAKLAEELIDNALKFSEPGTPVQISGNVDKEKFYLTVTNFGRGMTAEQIAEIGAYRQFERKMYEQQGCGLGLIIAKQIVEIHDGELLIQSDRGQQTTVRVALPIASH
jgi:signal transduction histidine kinase